METGPRYKEAPKEKRETHEETTVNGVKIVLKWDKEKGAYTISFPQITLKPDEPRKRDIYQNYVLIEDPEYAKEFYDKAIEFAKNDDDVWSVYVNLEIEMGPYNDIINEERREKVPDASFCGEREVNGVQFNVSWNERDGDYTICLPQVSQFGREASIHDRTIHISRDPEMAKKAFVKTIALAEEGKDPRQILEEMRELCKNLKY